MRSGCWRTVLRTAATALALLGGVSRGDANPDVAATTGPAGRELIRVKLAYDAAFDRAQITREAAGATDDPLAPLPRQRQLAFRATRQLLTPQLELRLGRDTWLSFAAPLVIASSHELDVAQGVDRQAASTFADGILPGAGFDARNPGAAPGGDLVLRDVNRTGIPELRAGLDHAVMNQAFDATKPTWKLGAELRLAVGRVMRFDAMTPSEETGLSSGVHQLRVWTLVARRYRYTDAWFEASWQVPLYVRETSLFDDPGFGAINIDPGQIASVAFGGAAHLVDDAASGNRLSVELGGRLAAHFEGRGYSEMWQAFALAGDRRASRPLVIDGDPTMPGVQPVSHPGISNIESYLEARTRLAVRGKLGAYVTLAGFGELIWKTDHTISFAPAGIDLPTCGSGSAGCEDADNELVNPGTPEVNPLHVKPIDLVGHRYRSEDSRGFVLGVEARLAF